MSSNQQDGGDNFNNNNIIFYCTLGVGLLFANLLGLMLIRYLCRGRIHQQSMTSEAAIRLQQRRRKKRQPKLMTQEKVDEKFPLMAYKEAKVKKASGNFQEEGTAPSEEQDISGDLDSRNPFESVATNSTTNYSQDKDAQATEGSETSIEKEIGDSHQTGKQADYSGKIEASHQSVAFNGEEHSAEVNQSVVKQPSADDGDTTLPDPTTVPEKECVEIAVKAKESTQENTAAEQLACDEKLTKRDTAADTTLVHETDLSEVNINDASTSLDKTESQRINWLSADNERIARGNTTDAFDRASQTEAQIDAISHSSTDADEDDDHDLANIVPLDDVDDDTCAICIDSMEDQSQVRLLTCGHIFHSACIDPWLTKQRACCPMCKHDYYVAPPTEAAPAEQELTSEQALELRRLQQLTAFYNVLRTGQVGRNRSG